MITESADGRAFPAFISENADGNGSENAAARRTPPTGTNNPLHADNTFLQNPRLNIIVCWRTFTCRTAATCKDRLLTACCGISTLALRAFLITQDESGERLLYSRSWVAAKDTQNRHIEISRNTRSSGWPRCFNTNRVHSGCPCHRCLQHQRADSPAKQHRCWCLCTTSVLAHGRLQVMELLFVVQQQMLKSAFSIQDFAISTAVSNSGKVT